VRINTLNIHVQSQGYCFVLQNIRQLFINYKMEGFGSKSKDILAEYGASVESECGKLDVVLMHRPGRELLRLRTDNHDYLLYDALPNITETHQSHDIFSQYLRDHGAHVLYLTNLLSETLGSSREAQEKLIDGIIAHSPLNHNNQQQGLIALQQWLLNRTYEQLAEDVVAGVAYSKDELGTSDQAQILLDLNNSTQEFVIPPLPNLLFMRDGFSIIEKNVFIWQMAKPARRNEPLLLRIIFQYHPYLSNSGLQIIEWQENNDTNEYPTIEGGDVAYIGKGVILIGCSERTNRVAIESVARTGFFHQVIAINIPPSRSYMHLDTILSTVSRHAFTLHGLLAEKMEVFTVETRDDNNNMYSKPKWISHGCNVREGLRKLLGDPGLIFYDATDVETSIEEQRQCRHNVVVIDDYHVVTYGGSDSKKGIITQMNDSTLCQVGPIPPQGLSEGGGGVHCMTNAIRRRAK
jgi:arginine deiminase